MTSSRRCGMVLGRAGPRDGGAWRSSSPPRERHRPGRLPGRSLMGALDWLRARMVAAAGAEAMVWRGAGYRHADLLALWDEAGRALDAYGVGGGRVVSLEADYAPHAVAMLLAMVDRAAVVVPLSGAVRGERAA